MLKIFIKKQKGFTLIELLVVISIIGILSFVILGLIKEVSTKDKDDKRQADIEQTETAKIKHRDDIRQGDIRQIGTALKLNYRDTGKYMKIADMPIQIGKYMASVPTDPQGGSYVWVDNSSDGQKFCVYATLENNTGCEGSETKYFSASQDRFTLKCGSEPVLTNCHGNYSGRDYSGHWSCGDNLTFIYRGSSVTYGTVSRNGECWMDRNLGASRQAIASNDSDAYGDLFQWGRLDDGHQDRNSGTTSINSSIDDPGHSNFILESDSPYDWRYPQNDNLWQGVSGTNNPCPTGWRVPTEAELNTERLSWDSLDSTGAFASTLKFVVAGGRYRSNGAFLYMGIISSYWSSTFSDRNARSLHFDSSDASMNSSRRADGFSVRCIKD